MQANDIVREINIYIDEKETHGALLLTGKWGCGKSYLIKELAKEINNADKPKAAVGIISLFGLNSVGNINKCVREVYASFSLLSGINKVAQFSQKAARLAKDASDIVTAAAPNDVTIGAVSKGITSVLSQDIYSFVNVKNFVGKDNNVRPFVLVFDDLERCTNISIQDRLGVLNEFVENKKIKVIVLADEEKIKDEAYGEFKEKLIARTLHLSVDDDRIVKQIIRNYKTENKDYKTFLLTYRNRLVSAFLHSRYSNLRTLIACLCDFERVFVVWRKSGVPLEDLPNQLYRFCAIEYEAKAKKYVKYYENDLPYGIQVATNEEKIPQSVSPSVPQKQVFEKSRVEGKYIAETFKNVPLSFSKWIVDGEWDEAEFLEHLKKRYETVNLSPTERFLRVDFWSLEQKDIDIGLPDSLERAYNGGLTCDELISLLQKVHFLRKYDALPVIDISYSRIDQGFTERTKKIRNNTLSEPERHTFSEKNQLDSDALPIYTKIERLAQKQIAWDNRATLLEWLRGGRERNDTPMKISLDEFDTELAVASINKFINGNNVEKRSVIQSLSNIDFSDKDLCGTEELKRSIDNYKSLLEKIVKSTNEKSDTMNTIIGKKSLELLGLKIEHMEKSLQDIQQG